MLVFKLGKYFLLLIFIIICKDLLENYNKQLSVDSQIKFERINGSDKKDGILKTSLTEINKTLKLIESNGPFPYRQDGSVFYNREDKLPKGDYREYTVKTPGASNRGARRIVKEQNTGETYYTSDHYQSFVRIKPNKK